MACLHVHADPQTTSTTIVPQRTLITSARGASTTAVRVLLLDSDSLCRQGCCNASSTVRSRGNNNASAQQLPLPQLPAARQLPAWRAMPLCPLRASPAARWPPQHARQRLSDALANHAKPLVRSIQMWPGPPPPSLPQAHHAMLPPPPSWAYDAPSSMPPPGVFPPPMPGAPPSAPMPAPTYVAMPSSFDQGSLMQAFNTMSLTPPSPNE